MIADGYPGIRDKRRKKNRMRLSTGTDQPEDPETDRPGRCPYGPVVVSMDPEAACMPAERAPEPVDLGPAHLPVVGVLGKLFEIFRKKSYHSSVSTMDTFAWVQL